MKRNTIAVLLTLLSFTLFVPGIMLPIFALNVTGSVKSQLGGLELTVLDKESSILQTIQQLWQDERVMVAVLIFMFSIAVPVIKGILLIFAHCSRNLAAERTAHRIANAIGKWSMADVFVVAIFLAFLSTRGDAQVKEQFINIMGMKIPFQAEMNIWSGLGEGFYYFVGYCLLAIVSFQLYKPQSSKNSVTE